MLKLILKENTNSLFILITTLFSSIYSATNLNEFLDNTNILQNPIIDNNNNLIDNLNFNQKNNSINNISELNQNLAKKNSGSFEVVFISSKSQILIFFNLIESINFNDLIEVKLSEMDPHKYYYYNKINDKIYKKKIYGKKDLSIPIIIEETPKWYLENDNMNKLSKSESELLIYSEDFHENNINEEYNIDINEKMEFKDNFSDIQRKPVKRFFDINRNIFDNTEKYKKLESLITCQRNNMELKKLNEEEEYRSNYSKEKGKQNLN